MNQEQEKIINNFNNSLLAFNTVLEKVPVEGMNRSKKEGDWTIRHVIHHVAEDCNVYAFIIERALAIPGSKVVFGDFPGNDIWAERLGFGERPTESAVALMRAHRAFLSDMVSYFPDRWEYNVSFYNDEGKELAKSTVKDMMIMLTDHMQEHTEMISSILKANPA